MFPNASLTTFLDFLARQGTGRVRVVRDAVSEATQPYDPSHDYWRGLREGIRSVHEEDLPVRYLEELVQRSSKHKALNYGDRLDGYRKWRGRKPSRWLGVERRDWSTPFASVRVNPELGIESSDQPWLIKLYFKGVPLSKRTMDAALFLLSDCYADHVADGWKVGILDLARGRLVSPTIQNRDYGTLLRLELAAFGAAWQELEIEREAS